MFAHPSLIGALRAHRPTTLGSWNGWKNARRELEVFTKCAQKTSLFLATTPLMAS